MQYRTFLEYNENRQGEKFEQKLNALCEAIAHSGVSFETYWENVGLPTILKSPAMQSEDELLNELFGNLGKKIGGWFGGGNKVDKTGYGGETTQRLKDMTAQAQAKQAAMDQRLQQGQGRADASVKNIMQKFQVSMRDFLKSVSDEAKQNNDRYSWQIAKMFHDKALKSMQNFAVKAKHGKDPMADQFSQDREAMQGQKQSDMKQQLQQKMQANPAMGAKMALRQMQKASQGNPSAGLSTFYDKSGGFTQAAVDQFRIPQNWVGKTVEQLGGGGQSNASTTSGTAPQGTNPAGPPTAQGNPTLDAAKQKFPNGAYMQAAHNSHEGEGDVMIESLVEVYSNKPKFGLF